MCCPAFFRLLPLIIGSFLINACAPTLPAGYESAIEETTAQAMEDVRLQQELGRQLEQGLFDEAEQTAARIEDRNKAEQQRCGPIWRTLDEVDRLFNEGREDEAAELQQSLTPTFGCETRPQESEYAETMDDIDRRRKLATANEESAVSFGEREPLFVEPLSLWGFDLSGMARTEVSPLLQNAYQQIATGDLDQAKALLLQLLNASEAHQQPEPAGRSEILVALTNIADQQGDIALANFRIAEAVGVIESAEGPSSRTLAPLLQRQAMLFARGGEPDRAKAVAERAFGIYAQRQGSFEYRFALHNRGVIDHLLSDLAAATAAYEESLLGSQQASSGDPAEQAVTDWLRPSMLSNLGLALWQQGQLTRAMKYFVQAQAAVVAQGEMNLDSSEASELKRAQNLLVELDAMSSLERQIGAEPPPEGALLMLLERKGAVLQRRQRIMGELRQAVANAPPPASSPSSPAEYLSQIRQGGLLHSDLQSQAQLLSAYEAAIAERAALASLRPQSTDEITEVRQRAAALDIRIRAMEQSIGNRAALDEAQRRPLSESIDPEELAEAYEEGRMDEFMADWMARAQAERARNLASTQGARVEMLAAIQAQMPEGSVLLEMVNYRPFNPNASLGDNKRFAAERYGTYVIHPSGSADYVDLGEANAIDELIEAFLAALNDPLDAQVRQLGHQLYLAVMAPIRQHLGTANWVFVAPAGAMNLLPFAALIDDDQRFLVESMNFSWLTSGRDLLRSIASNGSTEAPLIVANPAFDLGLSASTPTNVSSARSRDFVGLRFDALPATVTEATALKNIWPEARLLTGADATETALKQMHGPKILHIATHGFFLADLPQLGRRAAIENPMLRSGLALSGANATPSGNDDGVLTALEASGLNLQGTQLVVLSACNTGIGDVRNGEGVFGLRRAFVAAGAETLLMTLWSVDDQTTAKVMSDYHQQLAQGEGRTEAMRETQLRLLAQPDTHHPYYWASFIVVGNWRSL